MEVLVRQKIGIFNRGLKFLRSDPRLVRPAPPRLDHGDFRYLCTSQTFITLRKSTWLPHF